MDHLYATCDPGLEEALASELTAAGASEVAPGHRGVSFRGDRAVLWQVSLRTRVANRVLLRLFDAPAPDREVLHAAVMSYAWPRLFDVDRTIAVDASAARSTLGHTEFVAQVVKDAICDRFRMETGRRPSVDRRAPDIRINIRIVDDACTVSLDASGARLHRRGYRQQTGPAPLRETLAAGILALTGWTPDRPLVDPMCGSGTFLVEAALQARNLAPGLLRLSGEGFAFERWADHDRAAFGAMVAATRAAARPAAGAPIVGSDIHPGAVRQARHNVERAGVADDVSVSEQPLEACRPPGPGGVLVTNPPYGVRLGDRPALEGLYRGLGDLMKQHFAGWDCYVLAGDRDLAKRIGLRPSRRLVLFNGPIECRLLHFQLWAGRR